jgi:hypothetical protein
MKRLLWVCLGVAVTLGSASRGMAQMDLFLEEPKCVQEVGFQTGPSWRRDFLPPMLLGIHPLMAYLPPDVFQGEPDVKAHYQLLPFVVVEVGRDGWERIHVNESAGPIDRSCPLSVLFSLSDWIDAEINSGRKLGVSCPYVFARRASAPLRDVEPLCALENLERLLQADQLLKRGEALSRAGLFREAADCFEQVHRLVPGTNLEARAGEATQDLLVKVYGTATEPGMVDEACEPAPEKLSPPPGTECSKCSGCSKCVAKSASDAAAVKPRTMVYPVADLLGKGPETRHDDLDELMEVISSTVEPKSWSDNGGEGTIECYYRSRAIVIRQSPVVHEQVAELLAGLREARAQSQDIEVKPHHSKPADRAIKASAEKDCCEECCPANARPRHEACDTSDPGCCDECCPGSVLTLPADDTAAASDLELIIEGCTEEGFAEPAAPGFRCTIGGACAEACPSMEGFRLRWQIPIGPLTAVVRYEHRKLSVGLGLVTENESAAEESESPR